MARVLGDAPSLRGEHREVSILFSDLRGFTTLSERMEPERIAAHLNEYFDAMTAAMSETGDDLDAAPLFQFAEAVVAVRRSSPRTVKHMTARGELERISGQLAVP